MTLAQLEGIDSLYDFQLSPLAVTWSSIVLAAMFHVTALETSLVMHPGCPARSESALPVQLPPETWAR